MGSKNRQVLAAYDIPWSQARWFRASAVVSRYNIVAPNTTASNATVPNAAPATNADSSGQGPLLVALTNAPVIGDFFLAVPWVYRRNMDTSSFTAGAVLFLSTAGGVTVTMPSGAGVRRRRVGRIYVSNATTGTVLYDPNSVAHVGLHADLRLMAATELTIAAGAVTVSQGSHTIDTEADAASDNLDTISGMAAEEIVLIRPVNAARTVVLRHGVGNIFCPDTADISLAETTDWALLVSDGTNVVVLATSTAASEEIVTLDFAAATELTIAAGAVTVIQSYHNIDTEADAASDNLDTISGTVDGGVYVFLPNNAARTVVLRDQSVGAGNIYTPGRQPISLAEAADWAIGISNGTNISILAFRTQSLAGGGIGYALAQTTATLGGNLVGFEDAGNRFAAATVDAALDELGAAGYAWLDQVFVAATELTIAAGVITCTQAVHNVDTEADAASDNLDTINGVAAGEIVFFLPNNAARTVVLRDNSVGAGNIYTPGQQSISLAEATDWAVGIGDGTNVVIYAFRTQALSGGGIGLALSVTGSATLGAALVGIQDSGTRITATTVNGALDEIVGAGYTWLDQVFVAATELTIAAGVITCTQAVHNVDTEADAASDNLDTINGVAAGEIVLFYPNNAARTVVIRDNSVGAGNIYTPGQQSISLAEAQDWAVGVGDGTNVMVLAFRTQALAGGGIGLALSTTGSATLGANLIGIQDAANVFTGTTVEAALQELAGAGGSIVDLIFTAATELTIAAGAVTATQAAHTIDTEADAASDNLDTINGTTAEEVIFLRANNAARTVVVRDNSVGAGNIYTPGQQSISLAEATDFAIGYSDGTNVIITAFRTQALAGGGLGAALAVTGSASLGAVLVGIQDSGTRITATTVDGALNEVVGAGYTWLDQIFVAATELTIAAGVITCTQAVHNVDTEADAASDNLDTINGTAAGELILLYPNNAARTVVLRDNSVGAGNIYTPGQQSISLAEATDWALGVGDGANVVIFAFRTQALNGGGLGLALSTAGSATLGANLVGIQDASAFYTGTTLEVALDEVEAAIGGTSSTVRSYTSDNVVTDNQSLVASIDALDQAAVTTWPCFQFSQWRIDNDGAETNGGGMVGPVTLTEAAAAYAVVSDGGALLVLSNSSAGAYTANYQVFPDAPADDDAVYFGHTVAFPELAFDVSATVGAYTGDAITWEYWNGAWVALTVAQDNTNPAIKTGTRPFTRDGAIHFLPPADWASTTVNGQAAFWVRARISTVGNLTTPAVFNAKEHEIVTPQDGFVAKHACTIDSIRGETAATNLPAANAPVFFVQNFTTGAHTAQLTWALSQRSDRWTGLSLACAAGDELGIVITTEDGTNELATVALELDVSYT